jgi:hypothetical protein
MKKSDIKLVIILIDLEFKLIARNRKALSNFIQIIIIFMTLAIYCILNRQNISDLFLPHLMIVSLLSSIFILGHGLFLLTWESTYFGFLMTRNISMRIFFLAKFFLFSLSGIVLSFISIPVILFSKGDLLQYLSFLIFNLGVLPLFVVAFSFFNNDRASLDKGIFLNYEGYGLWQYIVFLLEIMLPGLVYLFIKFFLTATYAYLMLNLIGITGIIIFILNPKLFFNTRKYKIIHGFNQK